MSIQVIDNFLPQEEYEVLRHKMLDSINVENHLDALPWYIHNSKVGQDNNVYNYQFTHVFYGQFDQTQPYVSDHVSTIYPFHDRLKIKAPLRIKANLTPITPSIILYGMHTDVEAAFKFKTAVYYVNTNNGFTLFENGQKVESVANRICIFDGNIQHTGSSCTDQRFRCVINFNFVEGE